MRSEVIRITLPLALLIGASSGFAAVADGPPPDGCHWQRIPEIKATLAVPDGWQFRKAADQGQRLLYEVIPAGAKAPRDPKSRYQFRVQKGVTKETVVSRAKGFVEGALKNASRADALDEQARGVISLFAGVGYFDPDSAGIPRLTVAAASLANSRTGTLYTIRMDIPAGELEAVSPLANALFRNITVDDDE